MKGVCLRFFTHELQKHEGMLLYEWLLEQAKKHTIRGGSAFRAIAGYGKHGHMHGEHFFELASDVPVEVLFIVEKEEAQAFLASLKKENLSLFYTITDVDYGTL